MTLLWMIFALLIIVALLFLLFPLYRKTNENDGNLNQSELNVAFAKERLLELENDLNNKVISDEEYSVFKKELESALYFDLEKQQKTPDQTAETSGKWVFVAIALFVPVLSISLYLKLGTPEGLDIAKNAVNKKQTITTAPVKPKSIKVVVKDLVDKLKKNPKDTESWYQMGRIMMSIDQYSEAIVSFRKLIVLEGESASNLVALADAIAMKNGGELTGEPEYLLHKAITLEPNNPTALWLTGMLHERKGDHQRAISYWQKLYPQLADSDQAKVTLAGLITEAEAALNGTTDKDITKTIASPKLKLHISISDELKAKINGDELLFIYAKAMSGPPMPLAALKLKASDLPISVVLDDSMAMMPQMKLSLFEKVKVGARISKTGRPIAQNGDFEGQVNNVSVVNSDSIINIVINKIKK